MPKKLLNDAGTAVLEAIEGLVASAPHLNRLDGFPRIKVVVNEQHDKDKVAVISGGGSGHEPMHAGFVGNGMLAAAICGEVFASPSVEAILAGIHAVTGSAGCLLVVKNYTGDRLNFGIAAEKAKAAGLQVDSVLVAEDAALATKGIAGRRGLAGTILVHKCAGAAAAAGSSLEDVKAVAQAVCDNMATLGAALSVCTLPGGSTSDRLGAGDMEIGLGIHGEPGAYQCPVMRCDELMEKLVSMMVDPAHGYLHIQPGSQVCVMVNSLGSTTPMELSIALRSVLAAVQQQLKADIIRVYCGVLCTSLDMAGVSVTVMKLPHNVDQAARLAQLLDAPTNAPGWPAGCHEFVANKKPMAVPAAAAVSRAAIPQGSTISEQGKLLGRCISAAADALISAKDELNELDAKVGDGDCGSTLSLGATAVLDDIRQYIPLDDPAQAALQVAESVRGMGGTSGALYEILFAGAAGSLSQAGSAPAAPHWCAAFKAGVDVVQRYGGASPGSRTMVDALVPAVLALESALAAGSDAAAAAKAAADAAVEGAKNTQGMSALAGRSSYVPEAALQEVPDPGARGVAIWITAVAAALAS